MNNSDYKFIKKKYKQFIELDYWNLFNSGNIFLIVDILTKNECLTTFVDNFFSEGFGLQFFVNKDGFNYVHDIFSTSYIESMNIGNCDSICAVFLPKSALDEEDIAYLKSQHTRITDENNLILYRFKKGYAIDYCTQKELEYISQQISVLDSVIENEIEDIITAFKDDKSVLVGVDNITHMYSPSYMPIFDLERRSKKEPLNKAIFEEYKNSYYLNDTCYIYSMYLPVTVKQTNLRALGVCIFFESTNTYFVEYILEEPKNYKKAIWTIIDKVFSGYGLPEKMCFNSRDLYYPTVKTLEALNIEVLFEDSFTIPFEILGNYSADLYQACGEDKIDNENALESLSYYASQYTQLDADEDYTNIVS